MRRSFTSQKLLAGLAGLVVVALAAAASASASSAGGADLQISLSASAAQARTGDTVTFVAQVRNNGPERATSVRLTFQPSVQIQLSSASSSQGVCTPRTAATGGAIAQAAPAECFIGPLEVGGQARLTFVMRATGAGTATAKVAVTADQADPNTQNNQAEATTVVEQTTTGAADLQVSLAAPSQASVGGRVRFVGLIRNAGPAAARSVKLTNQLSSPARVVRVDVEHGRCGASAAAGGSSLTCSLGTLHSGSQARFVVVVRANAAGNLTDTASVTSDQTDPNTANNQAQATTSVVQSAATPPVVSGADVAVDVSGPRHARGGSLIKFVARVQNRGPAEASGVTLNVSASRSAVRIVSIATSQGTCTPGVAGTTSATGATGATATGQTAAGKPASSAPAASARTTSGSCAIGTLAAGARAHVTIVVRAHSHGKVMLSASVASATSDPRLANNNASVTTQLNGRHNANGHDRGDSAKGKHTDSNGKD